MLTGIVIGVLSASALIQQTDTTVQANGATRLELDNLRGEIVVRVWDRDEVRIIADHSASRSIDIDRSGHTIHVDVDVERGLGLSGSVDFEITVPRAFDLELGGMAIAVDIEGTEGEVDVSTVHGPVRVQGGRGSITVESVNGEVVVEDAEGSLEITGMAGGVTIRNCSGDIFAESVGGSLTLQGITSSDVEAGTVGGTVRYEGSIQDGGVYTFGSHGGHVWLYLPESMNARVEAIALAGNVELDYPGAPSEPTRGRGLPGLSGKEITFEVGTGSARVEVETFGGTIHILRQGGQG